MGLKEKIPGTKTYPVEVTIIKKRKNGYSVVEDKARRIEEKDSGEVYELKKEGEKTKPVPYHKIEQKEKTGRDGKVDFLTLYEPDKGRYVPIDYNDVDEDGSFSEVAEEEKEWQNWRERMMPDIVNAYEEKSFWQMYYPHILMIILTASIVLSVGAAIKFQTDIATQLGSVANNLDEVARRLEQLEGTTG